jgi:hypothetical protein
VQPPKPGDQSPSGGFGHGHVVERGGQGRLQLQRPPVRAAGACVVAGGGEHHAEGQPRRRALPGQVERSLGQRVRLDQVASPAAHGEGLGQCGAGGPVLRRQGRRAAGHLDGLVLAAEVA